MPDAPAFVVTGYFGQPESHTHAHPGTDAVTHAHARPDAAADTDCCAAKPHTHADGITHSHPHADACAHADALPKHARLDGLRPG
jgi:hypothetical protein